jgi:hypothetical protein
MVVTLLLSAVLSRSTSVPLVEVLDKEALSLAISPGACPHHTWQAIVMGAKRVLSTLVELSAKNEGGPMKFATRFSRKELLLNFSLSRPKKQRGGKRRHMVGCVLDFFWLKLFNFTNIVATFDAREQNTLRIHQATLVWVPVRTVFSRGMRHLVQVGSKCFLRIDQI